MAISHLLDGGLAAGVAVAAAALDGGGGDGVGFEALRHVAQLGEVELRALAP